jgi:hypothetical protein
VLPRRLRVAATDGRLGRGEPDLDARGVGLDGLIDLGRGPIGLVPACEVAGPGQVGQGQLPGRSAIGPDQLVEDVDGLAGVIEPLSIEEGQPLGVLDVAGLDPLGLLVLAGRFGQGSRVAVRSRFPDATPAGTGRSGDSMGRSSGDSVVGSRRRRVRRNSSGPDPSRPQSHGREIALIRRASGDRAATWPPP